MSAAFCLQVAAGELAAATRLRQARRLSACIRCSPVGPKLRYTVVTYWRLFVCVYVFVSNVLESMNMVSVFRSSALHLALEHVYVIAP